MRDSVKLIFEELKFSLNESNTELDTIYKGNNYELKSRDLLLLKVI